MTARIIQHVAAWLLLSAVAFSPNAFAKLTIEITEGAGSGIPVAAVPFKWTGNGSPPEDIGAIVSADLYRSGRFDLLPPSDFLSRPSEVAEVRYKDWRLIKAEALIVGKLTRTGEDQYDVSFELLDVYREKVKTGLRFSVKGSQLRQVAHQISDRVFYEMTGIEGAFNTRIAYVTMQQNETDRIYQLMVADSDGHAPQQILKTTNLPVLSPSWSPNGQWLAYVSFSDEQSGANVWLQDIASGQRRRVARIDGSASAPAWSPDGRAMALTISSSGNTDIYVMQVASGELRRITRDPAIDTEPAWSPDGRYLVFTSDRSGRPHIYRAKADGTGIERLTKEGKENAGASYDPSGERLVMVTNRGQGAGYQIGVFYLATGRTDVLTDGTLDESPTFSKNGTMILYATKMGREGVLAAVSADGRVRQILKLHDGDVREPAWSVSR
ncbi:MAG: Tol-Pal system beta propeller repeat protein TolB [Gammaproteobacteria bacterium]